MQCWIVGSRRNARMQSVSTERQQENTEEEARDHSFEDKQPILRIGMRLIMLSDARQ
jgi:hypothetical protein